MPIVESNYIFDDIIKIVFDKKGAKAKLSKFLNQGVY